MHVRACGDVLLALVLYTAAEHACMTLWPCVPAGETHQNGEVMCCAAHSAAVAAAAKEWMAAEHSSSGSSATGAAQLALQQLRGSEQAVTALDPHPTTGECSSACWPGRRMWQWMQCSRG